LGWQILCNSYEAIYADFASGLRLKKNPDLLKIGQEKAKTF